MRAARYTPSVVFDLGSRDGEESLGFAAEFPTARIVAFECNPATLPACRRAAEREPRIQVVEGAVHNTDGEISFFPIDPARTRTTWRDGNPGASSLFRANGSYPHETYVQTEIRVSCHRLDTLIQDGKIPAPDVLWMDLQGAEALALEGLGAFLDGVQWIWVEVSFKAMYHGQCMFADVDALLAARGFCRDAVTPEGWQTDVCYYRVPPLFDVVIPYHAKDEPMLLPAIESLRRNARACGTIFVVGASCPPLPWGAEWVDESTLSIRLSDVAARLPTTDRAGWYYQQLLKLCAPQLIPRLRPTFLVWDSDSVLKTPQDFVRDGKPMLSASTEHHPPYFAHMARLLPGLGRATNDSGVAHHCVFHVPILSDLVARVEAAHGKPFWQAFLDVVDPQEARGSGASEYELYFHFAHAHHPGAFYVRKLRQANGSSIAACGNVDIASVHAYMRKD